MSKLIPTNPTFFSTLVTLKYQYHQGHCIVIKLCVGVFYPCFFFFNTNEFGDFNSMISDNENMNRQKKIDNNIHTYGLK